ncbi:mucoidy inhibitor MuiA family protein [Streptomyces sp. NPDC090025]|uniref:mucoidy inhibitor MuiA family protein n=1 Tax=Streptomyces sp. NPDC090025 TaxID=3365922 RepID=UPI0038355498
MTTEPNTTGNTGTTGSRGNTGTTGAGTGGAAGTGRPPAADPLPLQVTAVTCMEDRALVERTVRLELDAGVRRVRLGPVSALAVDRTLHAELLPVPVPSARGGDGGAAAAASVLDVRLAREWRPHGPGVRDQDSALVRRLDALEAERTVLGQRRDRLTTRLVLLGRLAADLLRDIAEGVGAGVPDSARWTAELDRIDRERDVCNEEFQTVESGLRALAEESDATVDALMAAEVPPAELTAVVELTVEAAVAGPVELRLSHLTPCALWRPAYRAVLDGPSLSLETDAVVWQRTGEDWTDVRLTLSTARSGRATEPPRLTEDRLVLEDRSAAERRAVDIEVREEATATLGPLPVQGLPGVDDGGETRVLAAAAPVRVAGDGRAHRVPVSAFTVPAAARHISAPELSPLVTRVVRFDNRSGHALLAGPVDLVRSSGFTGRATLDFTAPGAPAELAFGSDDDYRVVRRAEESRATAGFAQRTVIGHTVRVHLSRLSAPGELGDQVVTVRERIPVSEVAAVRVNLREEQCSPMPDAVDEDGIVRWEVPVPPGGRRTVTLSYEIVAKSGTTGL